MGEWTVVASANRVVLGLFDEESDETGELLLSGAAEGCLVSAIEPTPG